jgi:hypothetical protein
MQLLWVGLTGLVLCLAPAGGAAPSPHAGHEPSAAEPPATPQAMPGHPHEMPQHTMGMEEAAVEPHGRVGSGTSWQPDSTPMYAIHRERGPWRLMFHGLLFGLYDNQGGARGATRVVAPNWFMVMAERPAGPGHLMLRGMFSLDPATIRPRGYPLLFQTGETYRDRPLVDAQHPHDLFMELAASYTRPVAKGMGVQIYAAPVGEPALGPVAYPHRVSAAEIPVGTLSHHLQDSTHISFGVLTGGLIGRQWKLEGSWFNGHEPDENRWDFDPIRLNSYSGRLSYNPSADWSLQVSRGHLDSPEALSPGEDVDRTTASATYNRSLPRGNWATSFIWGRNEEGEHTLDGFVLESSLNCAGRNNLFGRIERVDKLGLVDRSRPETEPLATVNAFSIGYSRDVGRSARVNTAVGAMVTFYSIPSALRPTYGSSPVSFYVFFRVRPGAMHAMAASSMPGMPSMPAGHQMPGMEKK